MKYIVIIALFLIGCSTGSDNTGNTVDPILEPEQQLTRLAFFGNSITSHSPSPDIGWQGDWGMAASMESLDYVNQTANRMDR